MKWVKRAVLLVLLIVTTLGTLSVQAAYNRYMTEDSGETVQLDLNKDGKEEIVEAKYRSDTWEDYSLRINNKTVIKKCDGIWLVDIDTRDKYIDIVTYTYNAKKQIQIYRYNGKKLVSYASAKAKMNIGNLKKNNWVYGANINEIRSSGNGRIVINSDIWLLDGDTVGGGNTLQVEVPYKVKKNSIKYIQSGVCRTKGSEGDNCIFKFGKKLQGYKYARVNSNKKIFTVNVREKVEVTNFKFTSAYTYMKVTKLKTKQTGWVRYRTKEVDQWLQID